MNDVQIRWATIADLDQITAIERKVFPAPWTETQIQFELELSPVSQTLVIDNKDDVIGYLVYHAIEDEVQILNFAIDIPYQHRGNGKKLLAAFLNQIGTQKTVFLEVKRSNLNAIKLYIAAGFNEVGIRGRYYENNEDALVLKIEK